MAGTKEGSKKSAETNRERHGADFYKKIGSKSWKNPNRSRKTGFALLTPEERAELGRKGGKQNKGKTYAKKEEYVTAEEIAAITEIDKDGSGISE